MANKYEFVKGMTYKVNIDEENKIIADRPIELICGFLLLAQFADGKFNILLLDDGKSMLGLKNNYDYLDFYENGLLEIRDGNKYGVMEIDEKILVEPKYKKGIQCDNENHLFIVKEKTTYGMINDEGIVIIPFEFKKIDFYSKKNRLKYFMLGDKLVNASAGINRHHIEGIPERKPSLSLRKEYISKTNAMHSNYYRPVYDGEGLYVILHNDNNQQALFDVEKKVIIENYWINDSINHFFPKSNIVELKNNNGSIGESCKIFNLNTKEYLFPDEDTNFVEELDNNNLIISINNKIGIYSLVKSTWLSEPEYKKVKINGNEVILESNSVTTRIEI